MTVQSPVQPLVLDPDYRSLKQYLIESTGLAYYADKDEELAARIGPRLSHLLLNGCGDYLNLLRHDAGESERHLLIGQLTIGETYFLRHAEQFDALRDVALPEVIERNRTRRSLRIWSAGCATGAEPYSLAILLEQHFADRIAGWDVQMLATDINPAFLARAARGEFDERALRSSSDEFKSRWFTFSDKVWTLKPAIKDRVTFQYHNLVEHPYPAVIHGIAALDVILCRNVMIYFDWPIIARIVGRFHDCLVDGGWLAVGHAESNTEIFGAYRTVNVPGATLYQKCGDRTTVPSVIGPPAAAWPQMTTATDATWTAPVLPTIPDVPRPMAVPLAPPSAGALADVRQLADRGQWSDAARACEQLLERDRLNPAAHFYRALVLEHLMDVSGAEASFRRAIYLDRTFLLAHYHLALLLAKTGRREAAGQSLRNVRRLLARMEKSDEIPDADGLTVEGLDRLAAMHAEILK